MKIIYDSEWNEDGRKPTWREFKDGLEEFSFIFTSEELEKAVEEERGYMSEEEKYYRLRECAPTYLEWVLSSVYNKIKPGQKIEVDEDEKMYRIIEL